MVECISLRKPFPTGGFSKRYTEGTKANKRVTFPQDYPQPLGYNEGVREKLRVLFPKSRKARFILALLVIVLLFMGWIFLPRQTPAGKKQAALSLPLLREEQIKELNEDTDGDGLKNWAEGLFGTDKNNPDTDGDGTPDGEEISNNRDPLLPGPNDVLLPPETSPQKDAKEKNVTNDFTLTFLKEPVAQIVAGSQPNLDIARVESYTQRLLDRSVLSDVPNIKESELIIAKNNGLQAIQNYFTVFDKIFKNLKASGQDELEIVAQALEAEKYEKLAAIADKTDAYQKTIDHLKLLETPSALAEFHKTVIDYLLKFKRATEFMQKTESDPIQALLAINERLRLNEEFKNYLEKSQEAIVSNIHKQAAP